MDRGAALESRVASDRIRSAGPAYRLVAAVLLVGASPLARAASTASQIRFGLIVAFGWIPLAGTIALIGRRVRVPTIDVLSLGVDLALLGIMELVLSPRPEVYVLAHLLLVAYYTYVGGRRLGFVAAGAGFVLVASIANIVTGRNGGWLDLVTIAIGFGPGVVWFLLRVEAMFGGRGDRFISGVPMWLEAIPTVLATYTAAVIAASLWIVGPDEVFSARIIPNLCLVVLYSSIGYVLLRTQLRNHPNSGGWSASGISLALVMYTCALMHAVFALYANSGRYYLDWHQEGIDIVAVPAACYFLWVTYSLYQGWLRDWNVAPQPANRLGVDAAAPVAS